MKKILNSIHRYSQTQFILFRIIFGVYLTYYLIALLPYAIELFSSIGVVPDPKMNFVYGYFPNILYLFDSPEFIHFFTIALILASSFITIGILRRSSSLFVWYGLASFFGRNIFIEEPSIAVVSWMVMALAVIPIGESFSLSTYIRHKFKLKKHKWFMPTTIYYGALLLIGLGFTYSGLDRLITSPSWLNGDAMIYIPELGITSPWIRDFLLAQPHWLARIETWAAAITFTISLPGLAFPKIRNYTIFLIFGMFFFILVALDVDQVALGILIPLLFIIYTPKQTKTAIITYDSICPICNAFIKFLKLENIHKTIKFQKFSDLDKKYNDKKIAKCLDSMLVEIDSKVYTHSTGVIKIFTHIGGIWNIFWLGYLIPKKIRDPLYIKVNKMRYRKVTNTCHEN